MAWNKVVVTGAAGFIGSHLCEALLDECDEVIGIDAFVDYYPRALKLRNITDLLGSPRFVLHQIDLRTDPLEELLEGADLVLNLAAMPGLLRSWESLDAYASCNILALGRLLEAAVAVGVPRLLHASTSSVYGRFAIGDEETPLEPVSPYGVTKLAGEHLIRAYCERHGLPVTVLRYFSVYGPRQRPDMAFSMFIDRLRRGEPVVITGDGSQSRSITYVGDIVAGTLQAARDGRPGQVYNLGGGTPITVREAVEILAEYLGVTPSLTFAAPRPGDQHATMADCSKALHDFGYMPEVKPPEGLLDQVRWALTMTESEQRPSVAPEPPVAGLAAPLP